MKKIYLGAFLILFASVFSTAMRADNSVSEKTIVFDFGSVIVHRNKAGFCEFIKNVFQVDDAVLQDIFKKFKIAKDAKIAESLFWKCTAEELNLALPKDWELQYAAAELRYLNESQEMKALIKFYKNLGYRIALFSNVTAERAALLRSQGFYDDFFPLLLSCELGVDKPDPKAYQIMLDTLQIPPENCIFIDDKPINIETAKALRIDAILFLSPQQVADELYRRLF
jgi:putative hydrolase of the HAD superfamily